MKPLREYPANPPPPVQPASSAWPAIAFSMVTLGLYALFDADLIGKTLLVILFAVAIAFVTLWVEYTDDFKPAKSHGDLPPALDTYSAWPLDELGLAPKPIHKKARSAPTRKTPQG
jgi:hypothetical protein